MGCVSSTLLSQDDDFSQIGGSTAFGHHIVSLTSTTYGLLTLDPPSSSDNSPTSTSTPTPTTPPTPAPRFTLGSFFPTTPLSSDPKSVKPEIINSWELMAGLDSNHVSDHSFRFSTLPLPLNSYTKENSNPNVFRSSSSDTETINKLKPTKPFFNYNNNNPSPSPSLEKEKEKEKEKTCPRNGENKIVVYTTTLRGIRKTFEDCNSVRLAIEGLGFQICERDISMDKSFKDELKQLMMKGKEEESLDLMIPPRVFVKGKYIGGVDEVMKMVEQGILIDLLVGLPTLKTNHVCEGCGGLRFLPCFQCNGSCKIVVVMEEEEEEHLQSRSLVVRCTDCNENGLIFCPICTS